MTKRKIILSESQLRDISKYYWVAYQYMGDVISSLYEASSPFASPIEPNDDHRYIPTYKDPITILLAEGISKSFPVRKVISYIKKHFKIPNNRILQGYDSISNQYNNTIMVNITAESSLIDSISRAMNACGYYLATPLDAINSGGDKWLRFEPRYDTAVADEIKKREKFLIHLTPEKNVPKIRKNGLVPYSKNSITRYPERVYLLRGSIPDDDILDLYEMLAVTYNHKKQTPSWNYAKVIVNTSKLSDDIKLFIDPNYPDYGIYTVDNIPPSAITDIRVMPISDLFA